MTEKAKLYLETSVVSYLTSNPSSDTIALARQEITRYWWDQHIDDYTVYISSAVLGESSQGDKKAARRRLEILEKYPVLPLSSQVEYVAEFYHEKGIVPFSNPGDALHLAFASIYGIEILATWNFKHLANVWVRRQLREINLHLSLPTPIICTPDELMRE